jgi:phosphatidylglycerophosphatase GEP4
MVQSVNLAAVRTTVRVLLREPTLALPHARVRDISELDFAQLHEAGCRGVIFDKDNTLTAPYANEVYPRLAGALRSCVDTFGAEHVAVLSNSAGTPDDPGGAAADALEAALGVHVLRRRHKKPRGFESVRQHFQCDGTALLMVGDRYLTDVVFGNLHGMLTVHTEQLTTAGDNRVAQTMRRVEDWLVARYDRRGLRAPPHPLALSLSWSDPEGRR